ncbi:GCD14-domain-containing protein [Acaromyces ingoldii]|uniref:tRNA (adenine(58)-N(1))-methyltransferase catalytic subunit TRM61 n=1 Tax=Acaromyces ingoldii TaxID=215250 RepID=A0A316YXB4_9BASI|nr:GCD14-domain-containing protein [Acaromyces ingoldii]PWN93831.1 GCD14-domain-containing protein [Acaromyces ingoldii]
MMEQTGTKAGGDAGPTSEAGSSKEPQAQEQAVTQHVPQHQQQKESTRAAEAPSRSKFISAGDLVIVWMSRDKTPTPLTVTPGAELFNNYGCFSHDAMIGLPFGAKLASRNRRGFVFLLRPSPEMWTLALPHRTQILYAPDMAFIAAHLGLGPGARVIEAGTGSGSFTHFLARTVGRKHEQTGGWGWKGGPQRKRRQQERNQGRKAGGREQQDGDDNEGGGGGGGGGGDDDDDDDDEEEEEVEAEAKEPEDEAERDMLGLLGTAPDPHVSPRQGRVWSFEFHAGRATQAYQEFLAHGLVDRIEPEVPTMGDSTTTTTTTTTAHPHSRGKTVSLRHRNVIKDGFGLEDCADAVFLDVPAPWDAVRHAAKALRRDVACRICCFSPCVEQVLKTVAALREVDGVAAGADSSNSNSSSSEGGAEAGGEAAAARWTDIETYECLMRTHMSVKVGPGQYHEMKPISEAIERIKEVEARKARRREIQIARARREREAKLAGDVAGTEAGANGAGDEDEMAVDDDDEEEEGGDGAAAAAAAAAGGSRGTKRPHDGGDEDDHGDIEHDRAAESGGGGPSNKANGRLAASRKAKAAAAADEGGVRIYAKPFADMRGHTSYLTFATLMPRIIRQELDPTLEKEKEAARRKEINDERIRKRREEKLKQKALEEEAVQAQTATPPQAEAETEEQPKQAGAVPPSEEQKPPEAADRTSTD